MIKKIKLTKAGGVPGTGMLNSVISFFLSYFSAFIIFIMFSASFLLFFGGVRRRKNGGGKKIPPAEFVFSVGGSGGD